MATCIYCKNPAGFLRRTHPGCVERHSEGISQLKTLASEELAAGTNLAALPAAVSAIANRHVVSEAETKLALTRSWADAVERCIDSTGIDSGMETRLVEFKKAFALSQDELDQAQAYTRLMKCLVLRDVANDKVPDRMVISGRVQLNLQKDEHIVWLFQSVPLFEDRTKREYVGGSSGISVRMAKGVYYRTGAFRGHAIEREQRVITDTGIAAFTNKNIYFVGGRKSIRLPYRKIVAFIAFTDGIGLMRDAANAKVQILKTGDGWFSYNLATGLSRLAL